MAGTRYLKLRGSIWYLRFTPPAEWGIGDSEFTISLKTTDLNEARSVRDRYLVPLLAESRGFDPAHALAERIASGEARVARMVRELTSIGGEGEGLTLKEAGRAFIRWKQREGRIGPASVAKYQSALEAACRYFGADVPAPV